MSWTSARVPFLVLALAPFAPLASPPVGDDLEWPTWRGPTGNGVAAKRARPPLTWSETENVRWKAELPGLGNSSPVVRGPYVYLTAAIDLGALPADGHAPAQPGPPQAEAAHRFVVLAIERATGAIAWQTTVLEERPHEKGHVTGSHASASISIAGERLVAFFGSRGLHVLDLAGKVLWSKDLGDMTTLAGFGEGSTPAVHGDTIVVQWDEEKGSFVAAFELATGAEVWSAGGMSKNPVNTAVVADGLAFVMNNYHGDVIQGIDLESARGEVTTEHGLLWSRARDASYVPTPVVHDGRLYFLRDSVGLLNCLDAVTGEERYAGARLEGARTVHASLIAAAGRIYVTSREGATSVVKAGDSFELLATNRLDDQFDATPAFVGGDVYLRGRSHLYCVAERQ